MYDQQSCQFVYLRFINKFLFAAAFHFNWIRIPDLFDGLSSPLLHLLYTSQVPHLRLKGQEPTPDLNGFLRGHLPWGQDSLIQDSSVVVLWKKIISHVFNECALCTSQSLIHVHCVTMCTYWQCWMQAWIWKSTKYFYSFYNLSNLE